MKRLIGITIVGLLLGGAVLGADSGKPKKQRHATRTVVVEERKTVAVHVGWGSHDVQIIRTHYAERYRSLPPGLRKKYARTGQLPPGWQRNMEPFPVVLERECAPLPTGYHRGVIDGHAVIYDTRGIIVDVAVLF